MSTQLLAKKQLVLIQVQTAWGTPRAITDSGYTLLNNINVGSAIPDPDVNVDSGNFIGQYGTTDESERVYVDAKSGLPKLPFTGTATVETMRFFLQSIFQNYDEGVATPYLKNFIAAGDGDVFDFTASDLIFTILIVNFNDATNTISDITRIYDCVIDDFDFTVEPNNRGYARNAKISGTFVGTTMDYDVNSATLAAYTTPGFTTYNNSAKFTLDSEWKATEINDICYKSFSFKYKGNISSDCRGAGGVANTFKAMQQFFFEITLPYIKAAVYNELMSMFAGGEFGYVGFSTGVSSASGYLNFSSVKLLMTKNPLGTDGDYWTRPLSLQAFSVAGVSSMLVALADAVDTGALADTL